jgi:hypothetical protein
MLFVVESTLENLYILYDADNSVVELVVLAQQRFQYSLVGTIVWPFVQAQNVRSVVQNVAPRSLHQVEGYLHDHVCCVMCGRKTR